MPTLAGKLVTYPARTSLFWYLAVLLVGAIVLRTPWSWQSPERPISTLDAIFTATSALCVTGLTVRSTPDDFSLFGQTVILLLMQVGGMGIMTITTFIIAQMGTGGGLRQQAIAVEMLGANPNSNLRWIAARVFIVTLCFELVGAALMLPRFLRSMELPQACWFSLFHSVSAFCNAGFSLYNDSMTGFRDDWLVNLTLMTLIIFGGLGYPVLNDLLRVLLHHRDAWWAELRLHSKLTLIMTLILITGGATAFILLETDGVLGERSLSERILIPLFHSVTCRTAGFNSVSLTELSDATLFMMLLLMLIGAGACSTAGGLKVSTVAMLMLHAASRYTGRKQVSIFRRTIPQSAMDRAMATVMLFLVIAGVAFTMLLVTEQAVTRQRQDHGTFLYAMFEVGSALATVGLSVDFTPQLSAFGRCIIIVLMFLGRLGPISVFAALTFERKAPPVQFVSEAPLVG
jgi:trk system potassium uptake protein